MAIQWTEDTSASPCKGIFSLRDLRTSKGITTRQLAEVLKVSKSMYHAIECGQRKPSIDLVYMLSVIYKCSMDFIYHAFYRQHYVWYFPDGDMRYSMREAKAIDIQYLKSRQAPEAPPELPAAVVWETEPLGAQAEPEPAFKPYGLERPTASAL